MAILYEGGEVNGVHGEARQGEWCARGCGGRLTKSVVIGRLGKWVLSCQVCGRRYDVTRHDVAR